jgi:hypothetical protein
MARLGVSENVDLARKLGWDFNAPNRIGRWRRGTSAPNYEATMEMLDRCGWLTTDARRLLAMSHLEEAAQVADQALEEAQRLRRRPPNGRARGGEKR